MGFRKLSRQFPIFTKIDYRQGRGFGEVFPRLSLPFFTLASFFLALDFSGFTKRVLEVYWLRGGLIPLGFYLFTWLGLILSLLILYTNKSRLVRFLSCFISFFSMAIFFGFKILNGSSFGYNEALLTVNEFRFAREAISEYAGAAILGIFLSLLFVFFLGYICKTKLPESGPRYLLAVVFFIGCMGYIIGRHTDLVIENFPAVFNVPALTCHAAQYRLYSGPRSEPGLVAEEDGAARHIVLIVDESIRGDHVSINESERDTTPFLKRTGLQLVNLGIASSAGNQSSTSNIVIQSGLSLEQVPDLSHAALKMPSIFQYAKNCGRKTFFINAQGAALSDYMTKQDLKDIDSYTFIETEYPESPRWKYDLIAADLISSILETNQDTFIYVLKNGAHFPYELMYPETERVFTPVDGFVPDWLFSTGDDSGSLNSDRSGRLNSYDNAVRWSVDGFFRRVLSGMEERNCLFAYVSDHGQSLDHKWGRPIFTHNTVENPPVEQANTPMFLLLSKSVSENLGRETILLMRENKNKLSHFQVFPSMLYFMGYPKEGINSLYGPTVFDPVPDRRYFISGDLFGRSTCRKNLFDQDASGF